MRERTTGCLRPKQFAMRGTAQDPATHGLIKRYGRDVSEARMAFMFPFAEFWGTYFYTVRTFGAGHLRPRRPRVWIAVPRVPPFHTAWPCRLNGCAAALRLRHRPVRGNADLPIQLLRALRGPAALHRRRQWDGACSSLSVLPPPASAREATVPRADAAGHVPTPADPPSRPSGPWPRVIAGVRFASVFAEEPGS